MLLYLKLTFSQLNYKEIRELLHGKVAIRIRNADWGMK
jgi:hypothetical protein